MKLWPELERKIPAMFTGLDIKPALLHGDLWGGNIAEMRDGPGKGLDIKPALDPNIY